MYTLLIFILILGITIFIHELGHFIFAKRAGVYIYEFSLGMGPKIWSKKRKNDPTEYSLRLFPIGGFVSMAGEGLEEDSKLKKEDILTNKPWKDRFLTIIAGVIFNFLLALVLLFMIGVIYGSPKVTPVMGATPKEIQKLPAYKAGIRQGDTIISLNDKKVSSWDEFMVLLEPLRGKELKVAVETKKGVTKNLVIDPVKEKKVYVYGLTQGYEHRHGPVAALKFSIDRFGSLVKTMWLTVTSLFTGKIAVSKLAGPVGIYQIVDQTASTGIENIIYLIAFLSINVGFINLLPFPAFDGGRLLFLIIEKVIGRPVKAEVENWIHGVGFILLMALMIYVTFNDILRIFGG